ncbi:hypothetical protein H4696_007954 [Amycolatopsis lexingtonensis]|uniref:Uncharacterized protein n=1 Tax=Amycolatopsis lexingtonensis TaxID=218822 RepID=A0ABR9ICE2_9PSEU|nr:DUF6228 family protein [Amycolatopsis lexingtonensis]MBE1500854.1 hypothetical protein [Amycolatopsis lexingtonensis]
MTVSVAGPGVTLTLADLDRSEGDLIYFTARAEGDGLSATVSVETLYGDSLETFAAGLDRDFGGWAGARTWTSFRGDLELRATHAGRVVELVWTLRRPGCWECTVRTLVTPGEELRRFSADVADFLVS